MLRRIGEYAIEIRIATGLPGRLRVTESHHKIITLALGWEGVGLGFEKMAVRRVGKRFSVWMLPARMSDAEWKLNHLRDLV